MKQAVMLNIICSHQPAIEAVMAQIPAQGDPRITGEHLKMVSPADPVMGTPQAVIAAFRCHSDADQAAIAEAIIQAVMNNIAYVGGGSSIRLHICRHDEVPPGGCEEAILYEVG